MGGGTRSGLRTRLRLSPPAADRFMKLREHNHQHRDANSPFSNLTTAISMLAGRLPALALGPIAEALQH
jgi:K+-transporting ATPase A subunit